MRSPVSSMALGEWNAIRSGDFGPSELTFSISGKLGSAFPISPFLENFPNRIHYFPGVETLSGKDAIRYLAWSLSSAPRNKFALASSP
jgi:hypothetical protein